MRETILSNAERQFILQAIKNQRRLDGRSNDDYRHLKINFGADWGSVWVSLGGTTVVAQVSCDLSMPKAVRPNEGLFFINVEIGPMAAPHFETGRNSELHVKIIRTLERTFKDSKAVDLESLCVRAEEHVWMLRVDLNVLNYEGNLIDCCSIATLAALMHFRRPDVSIEDTGVIIHTAAEKEPLPLVLHHHPVCITFTTYNDGKNAVIDPTTSEERVAESEMVFAFNAYRELCCLNLGGSSLTSSKLLMQCAHRAAHHAKLIVEQVKQAVVVDKSARDNGEKVDFRAVFAETKLVRGCESRFPLLLPNFNLQEAAGLQDAMDVDEETVKTNRVLSLDAQSALLNSDQPNIQWMPDEDDDEDDLNLINLGNSANSQESDDEEKIEHTKNSSMQKNIKKSSSSDEDNSSEEEEQVLMSLEK